jgi:hypothetical protein
MSVRRMKDENQNERDLRRSCSLPTCIIRSGENVPQKALTITRVDRFVVGCLPTTRDIYEPVVYDLGAAAGIVKRVGNPC